MASSQPIADLQTTVNRYVPLAGFKALVPDGIMGPKTLAATRDALLYVAIDDESGGGPISSVMQVQAEELYTLVKTQAQLTANAGTVRGLLAAVANVLSAPPAAVAVVNPPAPPTPPGVTPTPGAPAPGTSTVTVTTPATSTTPATTVTIAATPPAAGAAGFVAKIKCLPTWQQAALGAGAVAAAWFGYTRYVRKPAALSGARRRR